MKGTPRMTDMTDEFFTRLVGQPYRRHDPHLQITERGTIENLKVRADTTDDSVDVTIELKRRQIAGRVWQRLVGWIRTRNTPRRVQITVDLGTCSMIVGKRRIRFQAPDGQVVFIRLPHTG
jgi:hypothetical protein